jgi:hypothetical protein
MDNPNIRKEWIAEKCAEQGDPGFGAKQLLKCRSLKPGEPCGHPGCLSHISHPCEGCGRIAGFASETQFLTQEEVNKLPVDTRVLVVWSGGNGPHIYTISGHRNGSAIINNYFRDTLDFVGKERFHTRVTLAP